MLRLEPTLDRIHSLVVNRRYLQIFTVFTRCLLAIGFIPPSIPKILHKPFTVLPDTHPVGAYFSALYNTGFYYQFIGWAQITAAILLLIPRTAHIGAFLFLPIIVNIAVLTTSVGFKGTWVITILMSLAAVWLTAWEYDRFKPLLFRCRKERPKRHWAHLVAFPAFFAFGGVALGGASWFAGLGNFSNYFVVGSGLAIVGFLFGAVVAVHYWLMPIGKLNERPESLQ